MMIALVRKNLACLITKHSSCFRKSDSLSLHFFSTWRESQVVTTRQVYDVLVHKHHLSPEVASLAASHLSQIRRPSKADLILSFLEEFGFLSTQLERIVKYKPRILSQSVEDIKFRFKILQDLGLSSEDITKITFHNNMILHISVKNNIIPTLTLLKGLLGSDYDVARLVRKCGRVILADLEKTLLPNVQLLKSRGIPMDHILFLIYTHPWTLLMKPDSIRKSVEKAKEMGFSESSKMFIHAVHRIAPKSEGMWEVKLQDFRDLGFSDSDTLTMFKKAPQVFDQSIKKIERIKELLLATGKFKMSSIISNPASLGCSIEQRFKPRLRILEILESRNLIKKWPALSTLYTMADDKFFEKYVRPFSDEVGEAFDAKSYVKDKGKQK